jgi:C-terminal processing protease CtpA/Prc
MFKVFLKNTFTEIKNKQIKNLIIDIRKNGGGNSSLGDELLQYISKTNFRQYDSCFIKVSDELLNNYTEKVSSHWIDSIKPSIGKVYSIADTMKNILVPNSLRYDGNTYLLTSGYTFSSATDFASAFKCYRVGKIIGTETGGLTVGYGDIYSFTLPETKLSIMIPCKKWVTACGYNNHKGVVPDYLVEESQNSNDNVLNYAFELINKK